MTRRSQKNPHLKTLEQALAGRFGWRPGGALRETIVQAVAAKALRIGLDEVSYCRMAASSVGELQAFAEEVAAPDSRFFREPDQVEALRERVLPEILSARSEPRRVRAWCAACASGEEAYSLAIMLREAVKSPEQWRVEIMASDLRGNAILVASRGRYRSSAIRGLDPTLRNRYFIGVDEPGPDREFDVIPLVRRMVSFRRANLCEQQSWRQIPRPFDLVVCQNVLLYFHARAVELVASRFSEIIAPDGYLLVSPSESDLIPRTLFRPVESLPEGFLRAVPADDPARLLAKES